MLADRVVSTLRLFDLQSLPLTFFEVHKFLVADTQKLTEVLDDNFEVAEKLFSEPRVPTQEVYGTLERLVQNRRAECVLGFYCLPGRAALVNSRLRGYLYGIGREKLISRYLQFLRFLPFVRGVAIGGSQALGLQKSTSDIDLLIITEPSHMWLARSFMTAYFQILGLRRHHQKIANRFCLNNYLAGPKLISQSRDLYKAIDYLSIRPAVYGHLAAQFQWRNLAWVSVFFPNCEFAPQEPEELSWTQSSLEKFFLNSLGTALEKFLGRWQLKRILKKGDYITATGTELSFHSRSRKEKLFADFFAN